MPIVVLVDTNVWVSAFINPYGAPARVRRRFADNAFQAILSVALLNEIAEVLERPRIRQKYQLDEAEVRDFLRLLAEKGRRVTTSGNLHVCRDPDDDIILETAVLVEETYILNRDDDIKRDQDLIARLRERGVTVLSIQRFLDRLDQGEL